MTRGLLVCSILSLLACGAGAVATAQVVVRIDGSSTMFPLTEAVARRFQVEKRGTARVIVGVSGTSGGFRKFCRGETDIQDASRPILRGEMEACRAAGVQYFEIPVAFDAVTVAVSPRNTWVDSVSVGELRRMWEPAAQGTITHWSQIDPDWPHEPLVLLGAGPASGTFDYFTEAIVGAAGSSRADYLGSEDDNALVRAIATNPYALGYVPFAYYAANAGRLKALAVDGGSGPVRPSLENVANGTYAPLSRPLFLYVSAESAQRPQVRELVEFFLGRGVELIRESGYLPLEERAYARALERFRAGCVGTVFGGESPLGLKAGDFPALEPAH